MGGGIGIKKNIFFAFSCFSISIIAALILGEIFIRITDIPGIDKGVHYTIDPLLGYGDIPYQTLYYCNKRGDRVRRIFNSYGYPDVDHKKEKSSYRIGFFGDSYVEARQVPLENTFFRIIERELKGYNVECLAFGRESGSTLTAYLNSARWAHYFDIDLIVYVFCENDLGDNIKEIKEKTSPYFPFAYLTDNGYGIDYSNRDRLIAYSHTISYKIKDFISKHFLVFRLIKNRVQLVCNYGLKFKVSQKYITMSSPSEGMVKKAVIPDQNDPPSAWPIYLKEYAEKLDEAIILKWKAEVEKNSKKFVIFYIPRQGQMALDTEKQDSWKNWLEPFCRDKNIAFIDPTQDLIKAEALGKDIFYDHFTVHGHKAATAAFVHRFKEGFL